VSNGKQALIGEPLKQRWGIRSSVMFFAATQEPKHWQAGHNYEVWVYRSNLPAPRQTWAANLPDKQAEPTIAIW
jgi:hypothetical protein